MAQLLPTPVVVSDGSNNITLTHIFFHYEVDNIDGATVRRYLGYLDASGKFINYMAWKVGFLSPAELGGIPSVATALAAMAAAVIAKGQ